MYRIIISVALVGYLMAPAHAQKQATEETDPTASTETVCYAAADEWVCAPKAQEALARRQADRANQQQPQQPETEEETVQITTVPPVPSFENVDDPQPAQQESVQTSTETEAVTVQSPVEREQLIEDSEPARTSQTANTAPADQARQPMVETGQADPTLTQWLRDYPNDWTVQVIGLSNVQNLDQFFNQYGLNKQDFLIVETVVEAGPWWIVIFDHFPNRDAAVAAKSRLPAALAGQSWVRPINAIPLP